MSQRVLITAGANGIGLAVAKAFAAANARVHIADINAEAVNAVTAAVPRRLYARTISGQMFPIDGDSKAAV